MADTEFERTFLVKYLPENLHSHPCKEVLDIYIPASVEHPNLRLRKSGDKMVMTKKIPVSGTDSSHQHEFTIELSTPEFDALSQTPGKRVNKMRYYYPYQEITAEIDVFLDDLSGLVVADFEFESKEALDAFVMPDFCLVDVTQEKFIAGGMLAGKRYEDIENQLSVLGYNLL